MLQFIGITVLMIINLVIYHKFFNVFYFDLGKGLLKEIVGAYIAACLEAAIVIYIGQSLLGGILGILGWILRFVLIIVVVVIVVCLVVWIVKMIKGRIEENGNDKQEMKRPFSGSLQGTNFQNMRKAQKEVRYCAYCGKSIAGDATVCSFCGKEKWARKNN